MINSPTFYVLVGAIVADILGLKVGPLPISLPLIGVGLLMIGWARRSQLLKVPWVLIAFLAAYPLGLMALDKAALFDGIKEIVQCFMVFGLAVAAFGSLPDPDRRTLSRGVGVGGGVLLAYALAVRFGAPAVMSDARLGLLLCLTMPFVIHLFILRPRALVGGVVLTAVFAFACANGGLVICGLIAVLATCLLDSRAVSSRTGIAAAVVGVIVLGVANPTALETLQYSHAEENHPKRLMIELSATPEAIKTEPLHGHGLGLYKDVIGNFFTEFPLPDDTKIVPDTNSSYALTAVETGLPAAVLLFLVLVAAAGYAVVAVRKGTCGPATAAAAIALVPAGCFTMLLTRNTGIMVGLIVGLAFGAGRLAPFAWKMVTAQGGVVVVALAACLVLPNVDFASGGGGDAVKRPVIITLNATDKAEFWLLEAEAPEEPPSGAMKLVGSNDASGNRVLEIPEAPGNKGKGAARYRIADLPAGDYKLWLRVHWADGCSNSIGLASGTARTVIADEVFKKWHWLASPRPMTSKGGPMEFELRNLEAGVKIDQLLITPDTKYVPYGIVKK
jgi:hypothetical protein